MGKRESYEPGTFCWVDLSTSDPEDAKRFYGELFGWEVEDTSVEDTRIYTMLRLDDEVCALYEMGPGRREQGVPPHWFSYVSVEDVDGAVARARELGGAVLREAFDLGAHSRIAVIQDPSGAVFGTWQPQEHIGAGRVNDIGCMAWNELQTHEPEKATAFYSALFDWTMEPIEQDGTTVYMTIKNSAGRMNGGIMPMMEDRSEVTSYWLPYFIVSSCDEAVARVKELGGEALAGPMEPGTGRISVLGDPQGAIFAVFEGETDE